MLFFWVVVSFSPPDRSFAVDAGGLVFTSVRLSVLPLRLFRPCVVVGPLFASMPVRTTVKNVPIKPVRGLVAIRSAGMSSVTESFRRALPVSSVFVVLSAYPSAAVTVFSPSVVHAPRRCLGWPSVEASFATKLVAVTRGPSRLSRASLPVGSDC